MGLGGWLLAVRGAPPSYAGPLPGSGAIGAPPGGLASRHGRECAPPPTTAPRSPPSRCGSCDPPRLPPLPATAAVAVAAAAADAAAAAVATLTSPQPLSPPRPPTQLLLSVCSPVAALRCCRYSPPARASTTATLYRSTPGRRGWRCQCRVGEQGGGLAGWTRSPPRCSGAPSALSVTRPLPTWASGTLTTPAVQWPACEPLEPPSGGGEGCIYTIVLCSAALSFLFPVSF